MSVGAVNKQTGERIPTAGMPAIDDALDLTSVNPVQNAVITAALANKQDKTDNSLQTTDKTVVGAINEHEGDIDSLKSGLTNYEKQNDLNLEVPNRKNVFPITLALLKDHNTDGTWSGNDYTVSGVTFACAFNSDGYLTSITANGTSTAYIYFRFYQRTINPLHLSGSFVVSGGLNDNAIFVVGRTYNGAWQVLGASKGGDSNPFTVALSDDIGANIEADNGTEFTNAMFYPMIRPATITDPTFSPYIPSLDSRIEALEPLLGMAKVHTVAVLNGNVISVANSLGNGITFYSTSNSPTNQPQGHEWGSYIIFKHDSLCDIIYIDTTIIAVAYRIDPSTEQSITWKTIALS